MNKRLLWGRILYILAYIVSTVPPAVAFLEHFPVLTEANYNRSVSWFAVLALTLCCIPFFKKIKSFLKSPDAFIMWLAIFFVLAAIQSIVDAMVVVAFCGAAGNLIGKALFLVAAKLNPKTAESLTNKEGNDGKA